MEEFIRDKSFPEEPGLLDLLPVGVLELAGKSLDFPWPETQDLGFRVWKD